jgi:hypothetical protein
LRQIRLRSLLARLGRRRVAGMVPAAIPILPSADLGRTAVFYAPVGFAESERHDGYLLLHSGAVKLHFSHRDSVTPGVCVVHVGDAMNLWKQLRHLGVDGLGPVVEQDYRLREFASSSSPTPTATSCGSAAPGPEPTVLAGIGREGAAHSADGSAGGASAGAPHLWRREFDRSGVRLRR